MGTFFSEPGWLCLTVTAVLGGTILCKLKTSPGQVGRKVVCLAGLWGGACLISLSLFWGLVLFSLSYFVMYTYFSGQELLPVDQKAVLITGCDSGFGHGLAKYLDELGFTVFAGVLDEQGSGAEELRRTCSKHLSVLQLNITNTQEIQEAYSKVKEMVQNKGLWAVINNAGVLGLPTDGELIPMTEYKRCMAVNFFGAVEVTKAFLPLLRKSKGRLVNISSMAGGVPMQKMAAYGSSKAALIMFSSILRQELSKWGVKVSVIQPGGFKTIHGVSQSWTRLSNFPFPSLHWQSSAWDSMLPWRGLGLMKTCTDPDISPVLLDVRHAISAQSPFAFYAPGKLSYPWLCFASFSPTGIFDYLSRKIYSYGKKMPRVLSTSNWENEAM
uniref:Estradiol 17-beta-dehydrogenase 2 n=1 Tax=Capra hircus TaxID=9925 RepID=A0A8C2XRN9_CAPHI